MGKALLVETPIIRHFRLGLYFKKITLLEITSALHIMVNTWCYEDDSALFNEKKSGFTRDLKQKNVTYVN